MARAILSPLLSSLSGKLGNSVFAFYKGIQIVRELPTVVSNPNSAAQALARAGFAVFGAAWRVLSSADRAPWEHLGHIQFTASASAAVSANAPLISNTKGPLSGYNAFIQTNMNLLMSGLMTLGDVRTDAPIGLSPPPPLKTLTATQVGLTIQVAWTTLLIAPATDRIEIWITSIGAKIHKQLIYTADAVPNSSAAISYVRGVGGLLISPPPGTYKIQAQVINDAGLASARSEILFVVLPDNFNPVYFEPRLTLLSLNLQMIAIPWTTIDVSASVPGDAHAIIITSEVSCDARFLAADYATFNLRRDAAQDICMHKQATGDVTIPAQKQTCDSGIIPLTTTLTFDYSMDVDAIGVSTFRLRIYCIGYIH